MAVDLRGRWRGQRQPGYILRLDLDSLLSFGGVEVSNVTTEVGDTRLIVGPTGFVVPARDSALLADALMRMLQLPTAERNAMGLAARERVIQLFDLSAITRRYESTYDEILKAK